MSDPEADLSILVPALRERARAGASLLELMDVVHEYHNVAKYDWGVLLVPFRRAFGLEVTELHELFGCEIFRKGGSRSVADTEQWFRSRLVALGFGSPAPGL
jgi:hypothetical protein